MSIRNKPENLPQSINYVSLRTTLNRPHNYWFDRFAFHCDPTCLILSEWAGFYSPDQTIPVFLRIYLWPDRPNQKRYGMVFLTVGYTVGIHWVCVRPADFDFQKLNHLLIKSRSRRIHSIDVPLTFLKWESMLKIICSFIWMSLLLVQPHKSTLVWWPC